MSDDHDTEDEYRPTDWLAVCRWSYGVGTTDEQAIQGALRYAGAFDDDDTVTVAVWKLYADSWQSHSPTGPERGAEQLAFREIELPAAEASRASKTATEANRALDAALAEGETVREVEGSD